MDIAFKPPRLSLPEYLNLCRSHFLRYWKGYVFPIVAIFVLQLFVRLDVNLTDSLPDKVFLTVKGWRSNVSTGDYIAFEYQGEGKASPFPKGFHFVKIVAGVEGDRISMDESTRNFYRGDFQKDEITSHYLGRAKPVSKTGQPLQAGPVGVIPADQFYVFAPHPDSLDSRYALTGWVKREHIIGKTFALF